MLMSFEPLTGWREVVTERRRKQEEFALANAAPGTATLPASPEDPGGLGQPLNSYTAAALYESFSVEVARKTGPEDRVHLRAGARLMAEHGRDRGLGFSQALPQATVTGHSDSQPGG